MKKITSLWLLLAAYALVACASNPTALNTEAKPQSENKKKISQTQTKLIECAEETKGDMSISIVSKEIMFSKLNSENRTIIMDTHDLEYLTFATRSLIMFEGKNVGQAHEHELSGKLSGFKKLMASVTKQ